jgi:probable HAF family extracellular repeat protein
VINRATDDLGTLGAVSSIALAINTLGRVMGSSDTTGGQTHAFRTAANSAIHPVTDDLGTLGGSFSHANGINISDRWPAPVPMPAGFWRKPKASTFSGRL